MDNPTPMMYNKDNKIDVSRGREGFRSLSKNVAFCWVLHQHQPVGNFPWVFEQVYNACYRPLIDALQRHPRIRVTMHYSGPLLDWLITEHPEYISDLAALARSGQVEMMTGGYYEPILPIIPEQDQIGQIQKMTSAIRRYFGVAPKGLWLAERVWEPSLPVSLARAGVQYTILDDTHFLLAGIDPQQLTGYYLTEDLGYSVAVAPNPKFIRELIPWRSVDEIEEYFLKEAAVPREAPLLVTLADDGEKFGSWPGTYEYIWQNGYMDRFLSMLERHLDVIEVVPMADYIEKYQSIGRVYIPTATYSEMMEWALPTERQLAFIQAKSALEANANDLALSFMRGAGWRNFAAKYPEANNFHKKMLRVHNKIKNSAALLGPVKYQEALDLVWKAQCNCGYWHGVFGGLYLSDIRSAIYQNLVHAESIADNILPPNEQAVTLIDFDCDGNKEMLIECQPFNYYFAPNDGGTLFEWDWKETPFNVIDTLARRPEAYHSKLRSGNIKVISPNALRDEHETHSEPEAEQQTEEHVESIHELVIAKEYGLENLLIYDQTRKSTFRDHFYPKNTSFADIYTGTAQELGDFAAGVYRSQIEGLGSGAFHLDLWRDSFVETDSGPAPMRVRKIMIIPADLSEIKVTYTLINTGAKSVAARFGVETNWGLLGGGGNPMAYYLLNGAKPEANFALDSKGTEFGLNEIALLNEFVNIKVALSCDAPADVWRFPIETVSNSESGFERTYQCSSVIFNWPIDLQPSDRWSVTLKAEITNVHSN